MSLLAALSDNDTRLEERVNMLSKTIQSPSRVSVRALSLFLFPL